MIIQPFNLTSIESSGIKKIQNLNVGYVRKDNMFGFVNRCIDDNGFTNNTQFEWTGGGLAFRTEDYVKWLRLLHEGSFLILTN